MKDTDALLERTGETLEYLKIYAQQQVDVVKLEAVEKSAKMVSSLITNLIVGIIGLISFLMLAVTGALLLGRWWENYGLGFLAITILLILIGSILTMFRKQIVTDPIISKFITKVYETDDDN